MKKMNNKGFSMVELIIVIAIMAILAGALAPTLIKYVNKSRMSSDVSNAQTIAGAVQTAYSDPSSFADVPGTGSYDLVSQLVNGSDSAGGSFFANFKATLGNVTTQPKYTKAISGAGTPDSFTVKIQDDTATGGGISVQVFADQACTIELYPNTNTAYEK